MKKNLNISYLNGAEGLHKRGGASSGGSSGGEGNQIDYYDVNMEVIREGQTSHVINGFFLKYADRAVVNYNGTQSVVGGGEAAIMWFQNEIANKGILRVSFSKEPIYIYNEGSWKANWKKLLESEENGLNEHAIELYLNRFTAITKEDFYKLDNIENPKG